MREPERRSSHGAVKTLAVLATCLVLVSCASSPSPAPATPSAAVEEKVETIRLATTASTGALAAWVAEREGFFEDHKLDVKVDVISTTVSAQVPSLLGRQYEIASMTPPSLISAADSGIDVACISASYLLGKGEDVTIVIAHKDSGIKTAKDLAGKRLAAPSIAGNVHTATAYWLINEGVDMSSVDVVAASTPNMPDLLRAGQVDAAELTMPFVGMMLADGYVKVGDPLPAVADPVQMSFWAADRTWGEANKPVIKRFRLALDEAAEWIKSNKDKALDVLFEYAEIEDEYKKFTALPNYTTKISVADLEAWNTAMRVVTGFETSVDMASLVINP